MPQRLTVTTNAQNILQHFQGALAPRGALPPLPMPAGAHVLANNDIRLREIVELSKMYCVST